MWFFNKKEDIDYNNLVSTLEKGEEADIQNLLWQPKQGQIKYLPIVTTMLQKLKKSDTSNKGLSIFKKLEKGNYELIIFSTPWDDSDLPFSPLILDKITGKVVGVMLPFNELHNHISKKGNSNIGNLGAQWVMFTFEYRTKNVNP
jgi:hypothetical protein